MTDYHSKDAETKIEQTETTSEKVVIPVIEERVVFGKKVVETGKVRISKKVSEHEEIIDEPLFREEVSVERVAINQNIDEVPKVRSEGDIMIIPVVEERVLVKKQLVLVEELHVRKQLIETHDPKEITLRKEEVDVNRIDAVENANK